VTADYSLGVRTSSEAGSSPSTVASGCRSKVMSIEERVARGEGGTIGAGWRRPEVGQGDRVVTWQGSAGHERHEDPAGEGGLDDDQKGSRSDGDQESSTQN
jgi:hypothetical protein